MCAICFYKLPVAVIYTFLQVDRRGCTEEFYNFARLCQISVRTKFNSELLVRYHESSSNLVLYVLFPYPEN